jgi:hypothetical protein
MIEDSAYLLQNQLTPFPIPGRRRLTTARVRATRPPRADGY